MKSIGAEAQRGRGAEAMEKSRPPYEVERSVRHAERPGFRINELQISRTQEVPWHYHSRVRDTFYVLDGRIRVQMRDPDFEVCLGPGETTVADIRRPHRVSNAGSASATFLVLQGIGEYDFIPAP